MPDDWPPNDLSPNDRPLPRGTGRDDRNDDPERGQHLVWVFVALVICVFVWYW